MLPPGLSYDATVLKTESHQAKLHGSTPRQGHDYGVQMNVSTTDAQKKKKHETPTEESYSTKDPRYNIGPLVTTVEDVFHVHDGHNGGSSGSKAADHLHSLCLAGMIWNPGTTR